MTTILIPEDYGALGDGVADDTRELQACHDALAAAGGGTLWLDAAKVYGVTAAQDDNGNSLARWSNQYVMRYGLNLWGDNVTLDGGGEIRLLRKPPFSLPIAGFPSGVAAYCMVVGGKLTDVKIPKYADTPVARNLRIVNSRFSTADSIADAELEALNSSISGLLMLCNVEGFAVLKNVCTGGFGHIGVIGTHVGSRAGDISDNQITARKKIVNPINGAWASLAAAGICGDGLRETRLLRNTIRCVLNGIGFNANADNQIAPSGLLVADNDIQELRGVGLYVTGGKDVQFSRNRVRSTVGYSGGIRLNAVERIESGGAVTKYPCTGVQVCENVVEFAGVGTLKLNAYGFDIISKGTPNKPVENGWHDVNRNTLIRIAKAFHLDSVLCHDVRGAGNVFNGAVNQFDDPAIPALNSIQEA